MRHRRREDNAHRDRESVCAATALVGPARVFLGAPSESDDQCLFSLGTDDR